MVSAARLARHLVGQEYAKATISVHRCNARVGYPHSINQLFRRKTETGSISFSGVHGINARHRATTLELGGGIIAQLSQDVGLWINADYTTDISGDDREGVRGTAGLRVTW